MSEKSYVLEWSKKQNCFHVQPLDYLVLMLGTYDLFKQLIAMCSDLKERIIAMCKQWSDAGQREHAVVLYRMFKEQMPWLEL